MRRRIVTTTFLVSLSFVLAGTAAFAVDGVIEISEAAIRAAGGFPHVIGAPGSYRLTTNLNVLEQKTAIVISANDVTLDLNGFTIRGPGLGAPGAAGIDAGQTLNTTVRNGTVAGFSGEGIFGQQMRIEDVRVTGNANDGVYTGANSVVRNVIAVGNGADGIEIVGGLVTGCLSNANGGFGLRTAQGANIVAFSNNVFPANALGAVGGTDGVNQGNNVCAQAVCSCALSPCP